MAHVVSIDAPEECQDCAEIRYLCISDGRRLSREEVHDAVRDGEAITSGSSAGPELEAVKRGPLKYVRSHHYSTPDDSLLHLPRGC